MVTEIRYTSIKRVLDDLLDHPMLRDLTLEQAVRYVLRFIAKNGYSKLYENKEDVLDIKDYRCVLPCGLIKINQIKDCKTGICLRSMTDTFNPVDGHPVTELTFKTQGQILYTSFPEGQVKISYLAIPVDENGFPLLIDNEIYLGALEAYIKKEIFTIKFDQGKLAGPILQNAKQDYALLAGQLQSEFTIPSVSEMQSITNTYNSLIPRMSEFYNGFKNLGNREFIVNHNNNH